MKRIKVFTCYPSTLQVEMNKWIDEQNPDIISVSSSITYGSYIYTIVTVLYEDHSEVKI